MARSRGMSSIPLSAWLEVGAADTGVTRVRVNPSPGGGFIILTEETAGTFDVWVETVDEVRDSLADLGVSRDERCV